MKLFTLDSFKKSQSTIEGIPFGKQMKIHKEMYDLASQIEALLKNGNHPTFNFYFQKALSFYHRFAHQVSLQKFNHQIYLMSCLYLSAKDNDMFDYSLEIDKYVRNFVTIYCNGSNPEELQSILIEKIIDAESHVLQQIGYDLHILVPQMYFQETKNKITVTHGDVQKLFETAQKCLNDIFFTNSCLYFEPKVLALFSLQQASQRLNMTLQDLSNGAPWYTIFNNNHEENQKVYDDIQELQQYFNECQEAICC